MKIKLTTLSPVCIGNGEVLKSNVDFEHRAGKINFINHQFLIDLFSKNSILLDQYIELIEKGKPLKDLLNNHLLRSRNIKPKDYTLYELSIDEEKFSQKFNELNTIIKTPNGKPYMPGSTIKGMLKNAILYYLCSKETQLMQDCLSGNRNDGLKNLESSIEISLTDSSDISMQDMEIVRLKRLHLKGVDLSFSQVWESIAPEKELEFELRYVKINGKELSFEEVVPMINHFSQKMNSYDIGKISKFELNISDYAPKLKSFYDEMNRKLEVEKKAAFAKIGFSKGVFYNSVAMALYDADNSDNKKMFKEFLKNNGYSKINLGTQGRPEFPITRNLEICSKKPLGWVKLEMV